MGRQRQWGLTVRPESKMGFQQSCGKEAERKDFNLERRSTAGQWWHTPLIPAKEARRADLCEFKASLVYKS